MWHAPTQPRLRLASRSSSLVKSGRSRRSACQLGLIDWLYFKIHSHAPPFPDLTESQFYQKVPFPSLPFRHSLPSLPRAGLPAFFSFRSRARFVSWNRGRWTVGASLRSSRGTWSCKSFSSFLYYPCPPPPPTLPYYPTLPHPTLPYRNRRTYRGHTRARANKLTFAKTLARPRRARLHCACARTLFALHLCGSCRYGERLRARIRTCVAH